MQNFESLFDTLSNAQFWNFCKFFSPSNIYELKIIQKLWNIPKKKLYKDYPFLKTVSSSFSNLLASSRATNSTSLYRTKSPLIDLVTFFLKSCCSLCSPKISNCTTFVVILTPNCGFVFNKDQECIRRKRFATNRIFCVA